MGNELALRSQPVADWFMGSPGGLPPEMRGLLKGSVYEAASVDQAELPEVHIGQSTAAKKSDAEPALPAERINPTKHELRFIVPLADGPTYLGDIELAVSSNDALSVEAPRLLEMLKPILLRNVYTRLAAAVSPGNTLDQNALGQEGIRLSYNSQTLALGIEIPVKERFTRSLSFRGERDSYAETLKPARFNGYVNVHAQTEFVEAGQSKGLVPPTAALDAALRFGPVVAESEAYVSGRSGEPLFRRTGSRLVFDDQRHFMRWTVGDMQYQARPFQASPSMAGLGISRVYSQVDPQREIRASGAQTFSVLSPSMIETFVNGRSVERRAFQPGNYTLQNFPLAEGANSVKLRIEDSSGKVRTVDFSAYANQSLLAKGVTEFALSGGVYSTPTRTGFSYSRDWVASGFIRRGLSEQLTAGVNFQANRQVRQLGAEVLWGSPIGLASFSLTGSNSPENGGNGLAAAMTFERLLSFNGGARSQSIRASVEWRSKRFAIPEVVFGPERIQMRASAGYVMTFGSNSFVAADAQYSRDRLNGEKSYGARLSGGFDLNSRLTANAEVGYNRGSPRNETYARFGLRMRLSDRATMQVDADSTGRARASYSNSGGSGNGAWQTSADLNHERDTVSLNANASLLTNRAELGIQQSAGWSKQNRQLTDARTSVRAAFALAFADGSFAVGRPVSEAFVIAQPHRTLRGKSVYLDPSERSETARSGSLGPALDGQMSAHNFRTLIYQVPDAPSGYDLGAGNIAIKPPYRAGYRLVIGSDYHLLVLGRLLDGNGEPVKLLAGQAQDLDDPKHPAITLFTSRDGKFGAQGLRPGHWRIEMPTEPPIAYEFTVTDSADGIARTGDLHPAQSTGKRR
jgi:outer membrane usher protein